MSCSAFGCGHIALIVKASLTPVHSSAGSEGLNLLVPAINSQTLIVLESILVRKTW